VDGELQPIVHDQALYFKNLVELKTDLEALSLPANASLFTYDAVAMDPSINTSDCLVRLTGYLSKPEISGKYGFSSTALLEAIELVMFNNRMRFGDIIVKQISGIAILLHQSHGGGLSWLNLAHNWVHNKPLQLCYDFGQEPLLTGLHFHGIYI
jgi:hypothetical protein